MTKVRLRVLVKDLYIRDLIQDAFNSRLIFDHSLYVGDTFEFTTSDPVDKRVISELVPPELWEYIDVSSIKIFGPQKEVPKDIAELPGFSTAYELSKQKE